MSLGKAIGEFSFTSTGVTVSSNPGEEQTMDLPPGPDRPIRMTEKLVVV
jgi:K+/H+ antiporter YhaU regulatory subunit KhtT